MATHFLLRPIGRDFSLKDIDGMTETRAHALFARCRWASETEQVCPECGTVASHYWIKSRKQWRCKDVACGRMFSVTSGTVFADHKLPLRTILHGILLFVSNVKGISALAMSRYLGVAYSTAFVLVHKIREAVTQEQEQKSTADQLGGLVHVDGAHMSGRIRKPRVKKKASKTQARDRIPADANAFHPNRRIVMVMREVSKTPGVGATRTVVQVVRAEDSPTARALAQKYISKNATVMTDEHPAYSGYMARYQHLTVNHSVEFSTDEGVNNNHAESFFARMRRMVIGQAHRVTPKYMYEYMSEVAWREDNRRASPMVQSRSILQWASKVAPEASSWRGYWQGKRRQDEVLFVPRQESDAEGLAVNR